MNKITIEDIVKQNPAVEETFFVTETSPFGDHVGRPPGSTNPHKGVDIDAPRGSTVHSIEDGFVAFERKELEKGKKIDGTVGIVSYDPATNQVTVTRYFHNKDITVNVGDQVPKGGQVATLGDHLHLATSVLNRGDAGFTEIKAAHDLSERITQFTQFSDDPAALMRHPLRDEGKGVV